MCCKALLGTKCSCCCCLGWNFVLGAGKKQFHTGLDLAVKIGTPIYAPADGVVKTRRSNRKKGYGNLLKIDHAFGFVTLYAHLDKFNVKRGQFVKKGDLIGWSGNTGYSSGPHLHYEIHFLSNALNPENFITWTPENFQDLFLFKLKLLSLSFVFIGAGSVWSSF